jgi:hypothetical protein
MAKKKQRPAPRAAPAAKPAKKRRNRTADTAARKRTTVAKIERAEKVAAAMVKAAAAMQPFGVPDEKWESARAAIVAASTLDGEEAIEVAADALLTVGKYFRDVKRAVGDGGLHELGHEALRATMVSVKSVPALIKVLALRRRKKRPIAALVSDLGQEVTHAVDANRGRSNPVVRAEPADDRRVPVEHRQPPVGEGQAVPPVVRVDDLESLVEQSA